MEIWLMLVYIADENTWSGNSGEGRCYECKHREQGLVHEGHGFTDSGLAERVEWEDRTRLMVC
jgi:hypothetical protein